MAKRSKTSKPRTFSGMIRKYTKAVQGIALALREAVYDAVPDAEESFYPGQRPMSMYRTSADLCWIQPLKSRCNFYLLRGPDLSDPDGQLEGTSDRHRFARVHSEDDVETLPIRAWVNESISLNQQATADGLRFDDVLTRVRAICQPLPQLNETTTWGKPHFRVGEKIFCGCSEDEGRPKIGLKMESTQSEMMMNLPGITKAAYSRPGDGWVSIDPNTFDDWDEIARLVIGSFCLIAPKRISKSVVIPD